MDPTPAPAPVPAGSTIKVGRGGAGNVYTPEDVQSLKQRTAEDLEAQSSTNPTPVPTTRPVVQKYARSGRGGAGNWFSAAEEAAKQQQQQSLPTVEPAKAAADGTQKPGVKYRVTVGMKSSMGRGGAGNIYEAKMVEEARKKDEEKKAEAMRRAVEAQAKKDVEVLVGPPPRAFLGGRQAEGV